jgi:hypothetical protein
VPVVRPERIRARRCRDRLVEHEDNHCTGGQRRSRAGCKRARAQRRGRGGSTRGDDAAGGASAASALRRCLR